MSTLLIAAAAAIVLLIWRLARTASIAQEAIKLAREGAAHWKEADADARAYGEAWCDLAEALLNEIASDEQVGEALRRGLDAVQERAAARREREAVEQEVAS